MIITKKQIIKAINDSIKHWNKDIIEPLENGKKIINNRYYLGSEWQWKHNNKDIRVGSYYCELCTIFHEECDECPLNTQIIGCDDPDSPWSDFYCKPTLTNARKMVKALQKIDLTKIEDVEIGE